MSTTTETQGNEKAHKEKDLFNALVPVRAWMQDKNPRSWMAALLVVPVAVPAIRMVITSPAAGAWVFAGFFAVAWLLLLFVIVWPQNITAGPLAVVVVLGLIVEAPLAIALESASGASTSNIFASVFEVGVPEELSKMVPLLVIAAVVLSGKAKASWLALKPRD